jgi:hypothetical protein
VQVIVRRSALAVVIGLLAALGSRCLGEQGGNQPNPHHAVSLHNDWTRSVTLELRVVRTATNETVHAETYELEPGAEREVYDTAAADPDGIERFAVVLTTRNETQRVEIETNACYGYASGGVSEGGDLESWYSIRRLRRDHLTGWAGAFERAHP